MIKVLEVIEHGVSDHVRELVSALRAGFDPAKFDVSLIDAAPGMTTRELYHLFIDKRPEVVHIHSSNAGMAALAAANLAGIKKILRSPRGGSDEGGAMSRLLRCAAACLGETVALRPAYLGDCPEPLAHDGVVVGSAGDMTRERNPDAWVLLAQRLTDSRNGIKCAWIGGGDDEEAARTHLANMNLLAKVAVTGRLPADQAREKLRGLDVFVQYSRNDAGAESILDAMACGLPVVASDIPAHRDLVAEGVTGFLADGEVKLLERCQRLLDDDVLRRRLGAAGRERVRNKFTRERLVAELSRLYSA